MAGFLRDWFFPEHMVPAGSEGLVYCFSDVASGGLWYTTRRPYLCGRRRETLAVPLADHPERHRVNRPGGVCRGALLGLPGKGDHGSRQARNPAGRPFLLGGPNIASPAGRGDRLGRLPYASPVSSLLLPPWAGDRARRTSSA